MKNFLQHSVAPVVAAVIWGTAFAMQSVISDYLPAFTVNAIRGFIAFTVLFSICLIFRIKPGKRKDVIAGSLIVGVALFAATNLQQFGIGETSAGKSGFITALYIVLVPIFGVFFHKETSSRIWIAVLIALTGMYFLCVTDEFTITAGDVSLLMCAIGFTIQIHAIDHYSAVVDPIALTAGEFLVTGILSLLCSLIFETPVLSNIRFCMWEMIYVSIACSCFAYFLQIVAQKGGNPTVVSLLMSLESVFAVIGGVLILNERMTEREMIGCALMAVAIVIAQLPHKKAKLKPA